MLDVSRLLRDGPRQSPRRDHRGWIDLSTRQEEYVIECTVRDLDGDGIDEVYLYDFAGKSIKRVSDPAAPLRAQLFDKIETLRQLRGEPCSFSPGVDAAEVKAAIDDAVSQAGLVAEPLSHSVWRPA